MKKVKFLFMAFLAVAITLASCSPTDPKTPVVPPVDELEEQPEIAAPAAGKVIVAIRVPAGTCNGVVLTGSPFGWNPASGTAAFELVEGTETWYSVELDYAVGAMLKAIAVPETGTTKWETQWKDIEVLEGDATITVENETEPRLDLGETSDGTVIFVTIGDWKTAPCAPVIPGGEGTFTFTPTCAIPDGGVVTFTGNFDTEEWGNSTRVMTAVGDGSYTWTGTFPDGFQMKVFVGTDWMQGDNVTFDGTTYSFTGGFSFCEVVEVVAVN